MSFATAFTRSRQAFFTGATLITLLALGLRLFRLANQSFWIDEVSSLMVAQGPLDGIFERSALASNSLPTFFLLLKPFVGTAPGEIEFRARLLSVIAGTLSVPLLVGVVYFWRRQRGAALLAGILLAVNPLHLWYSQEVRGYAVMLFFGLLTLFCFERAREKQKAGWWVLYVLSALMVIAVHKTGMLFPAVCGLWHAWEVLQKRDRLKRLFFHAPLAVATLIVFALKSHPPPDVYGRSSTGLEIGYTFLTFLGGYSFGPSLTDIQSSGALAAVSNHAVETGIMLAVLLALAITCASRLRRLIFGKELQLLLLVIGVISLYSLCSHFPYNVRYALPGLFGFLALVAVLAVEPQKSLWPRISLAGLLMVALWADAQWFYSWQYRKGDSRAVAHWLVQHEDRIHSWTALPGYMQVPIEWYLRPNLEGWPRAIPSTSESSTSFLATPDVLIITRRHHIVQPDQLIASYQSRTGGAQTNREFAAFELYIGNVSSPDSAAPRK